MKYTTNIGLHAMLRAFAHYGIDIQALIKEKGISVPSSSNYPEHIPPIMIEKILELGIQEAHDEAFPLKVAEYIPPTIFDEFSISLLSSMNIYSFLQRFARYYPFISTSQKLRLVQQKDFAVLLSIFTEKSVKKSTQWLWTEVTIAFVVRFIRLVFQPDYFPLKLELIRPTPINAVERYRHFFGILPDFGSCRNALYFRPGDLNIALPSNNLEIAAEYETKIIKKLADMQCNNLPMQVNALLIEQLPTRPLSKERVAKHFAMSTKTFQLKLHEAGTTYQTLLDGARFELAERYLSFPNMSLDQVAENLGYSDASNFCRAYKRWTGHVPHKKSGFQQYRML